MPALGLSFLLALVAAAVFWFFAFFVPGERQDAIGEWRRELSQRADNRRDLLDRQISERVEDARFFALFPSVEAVVSFGPRGSSGVGSSPHIGGILSNSLKVYGYRSVSICDLAGAVLVSSDGPAPGAEDVALAREAARTGEPRVDLVREPGGFVALVVAAPVRKIGQDAGPGGGLLVVSSADESVFDLLLRPVSPATGEAVLVQREGDSALYVSPLRFRPDPPFTFRRALNEPGFAARAALEGDEDFGSSVDYRGVKVFAAARRLKRAPWGLVVKVDEEEALAPFRKDVRQKGITWGALLLALFAAAAGSGYSVVTTNKARLARSEALLRRAEEERIPALNRLLRTIMEVNQLIVKGPGEERLLAEACRILVGRAGYVTAWIGRVDPETKRVELAAHAGEGRALLESLEIRCDDSPLGRGPVGTAIREGRSVVVADARSDPSLEPWRERVRFLGVGATAALPLRRGGVVTAGLAVFAPEGAGIDGENLALLEELAGDISFALDVLDAREKTSRSEQQLRNLRQAVEQTPATVVITDLEGRIEYVNPSFTQVTGYTAEEALGRNPRMLKSDRTPPGLYEELWTTILGGRTWSGEICNKRKDGTLFWELASISPVRDEAGVTRHYVAVKEDITERKRTEENVAKLNAELEEALAWQRQIFEGSRDAVFVSDEEARFVAVNEAATKLTGYSRTELLAMGIPGLHEEPDLAAYRAFHRRILGGEQILSEALIRMKDGGKVAVEFNNRLVTIGGRRFMHTAGRDLTERRHLEAQLLQAQKMEAVGRLAGGVAHDFNNLLTVIQGYGELLALSLEGDAERRENVGEIVKAAERASTLTRQLLAFSRRQVLETRILDLGEVVTGAEKMLRRLIGEDVEVVVVKPAALGRVKADPGQIEQVLLNLAVNSRDAMPGGGRLTIELLDASLEAPLTTSHDSIPPGPYVVVSVRDTGCGMDAGTFSHLFEPFFTTKEKGKGTGLGLATVFGIVKQSGGYVDVESAPGAGTTFRVYLPRSDAPATSGVRPRVRSRAGSETVLLVEDEAAVRNLVKAVLERKGYAVLAASDGAAALALVDGHAGAIHLLLTDVVMPGMNGRDLAARVKAKRPAIKVVFMSGYPADAPADFGMEGGPAFLSKPFNERALSMKLREVLDARPA